MRRPSGAASPWWQTTQCAPRIAETSLKAGAACDGVTHTAASPAVARIKLLISFFPLLRDAPRLEHEFPVGIALRAFELGIFRMEAAALERPRFRQAVPARDAAAGRIDDAPFGLAGHRVGIDAPQMPAHDAGAAVLEQVFQRARVRRLACRGRAGVAGERIAEL